MKHYNPNEVQIENAITDTPEARIIEAKVRLQKIATLFRSRFFDSLPLEGILHDPAFPQILQEVDDRAEDPKATKLIIEKREVVATNISSQQHFNVKLLNLGRSQIDKPYSYYHLSDLSRTDSVQVLMRTNQHLKNIGLPERMLSNIARFLREDSKPREGVFDCASFAHLVNDISYEFGNYQARNWDMKALNDENDLKPGDTIVIANTENPNNFSNGDITHFAIYLEDGLYISKFGDTGKLIVANLEEMRKGFGGAYFFQANPKKQGE